MLLQLGRQKLPGHRTIGALVDFASIEKYEAEKMDTMLKGMGVTE